MPDVQSHWIYIVIIHVFNKIFVLNWNWYITIFDGDKNAKIFSNSLSHFDNIDDQNWIRKTEEQTTNYFSQLKLEHDFNVCISFYKVFEHIKYLHFFQFHLVEASNLNNALCQNWWWYEWTQEQVHLPLKLKSPDSPSKA
jgi:hypothetical protein